MKNTKTYIFTFFIFFLFSCKRDDSLKKYPDFSKNIENVSDFIIPIKTDILLGKCNINIGSKYLFVNDWNSFEKGFLLFDKRTLKHIISTGSLGQGPGEVINYRNAVIIPNQIGENSFFVFDYSQLKLYVYDIDSILQNPKYLPKIIANASMMQVLGDVNQLNDSIFIGIASKAINSHSFIDEVSKININNFTIKKLGYENSEVIKKGDTFTHGSFTLSHKYNIYGRSYIYTDLLTLCDINGNLRCNILGPYWGKGDKKLKFYQQLGIYKNYILAAYVGGNGVIVDEHQRYKGVLAKKILVFNLNGDYLKTLNIGEGIRYFTVDEDTKRLLLSLEDRDEPLAYLDLTGLLD